MMRSAGRTGQGRGRGKGRGLGGGDKPGSGPSGFCICPKCGYKLAHTVGQRCSDMVCPHCDTKMTRE